LVTPRLPRRSNWVDGVLVLRGSRHCHWGEWGCAGG
jgi:hypothetical protein